jgi:hypothetical protein
MGDQQWYPLAKARGVCSEILRARLPNRLLHAHGIRLTATGKAYRYAEKALPWLLLIRGLPWPEAVIEVDSIRLGDPTQSGDGSLPGSDHGNMQRQLPPASWEEARLYDNV